MFTVSRALQCGWLLCSGLLVLSGPGCASKYVATPPAIAAAAPGGAIGERFPDPDPRYLPPPSTDGGSGWGIFSTEAISNSYKSAMGRLPNHVEARQLYADGEILFKQQKYDDAAKLYAKAAIKWPDSPLEEDAFFFQSECQFFADRYSKANDNYSLLLKKYPSSRYLDQAIARQFAIAEYWEKTERKNPHWIVTPNFLDKTRPWFDTEGNALATWDHVRLKDPTGPLADSAIMATANAHFLDGHWEEADYYYTLIRKDYPKSRFQVQAHLLDLQAKLKKYQGPEYDSAPLKEADELITQMLRQFPNELQGERDRLLAAKTDVRGQLARRDWQRAEYYAKGEYYGAAKVYYASLVKEFPNSNYANLAQERINAYHGKPDVPLSNYEYVKDILTGQNPANVAKAAPATTPTKTAPIDVATGQNAAGQTTEGTTQR
ncbi:MAG TPA: outer membrane protein assembly factor BamD [Pirellulales bacterium]|jgi:outer membrane protein assembly factor BamD (BamD/ComL family)|nr:outer membrane protein assembly factor BamD [Pirellulales bacterium]